MHRLRNSGLLQESAVGGVWEGEGGDGAARCLVRSGRLHGVVLQCWLEELPCDMPFSRGKRDDI